MVPAQPCQRPDCSLTLMAVFLAGFAAVTVLWRRADAEARRANRLSIAEAEAREAESRRRIQAQAEIATRDFDRGLELARRGDGDLGIALDGRALRQAPPEQPAFARMVRANLAALGRGVAPPPRDPRASAGPFAPRPLPPRRPRHPDRQRRWHGAALVGGDRPTDRTALEPRRRRLRGYLLARRPSGAHRRRRRQGS